MLQYTSGSTGSPRGVMVTHANLMTNLDFIRASFEVGRQDTGVIWLPPYHDMGLIGGILGAFYCGNPVMLLPPMAFLKRPLRWLETISKMRAAISGGPNFAYDLCTRRISPEDRGRLDLSTWTVAFTGAEPIRASTLDRFAEMFAECGFRREAFCPCYGLAEATLMATAVRKSHPPAICSVVRRELEQGRVVQAEETDEATLTLVGCGATCNDSDLVIADPDTAMQFPAGAVGEIWLSGPGIARGYWRRPEESQHTFYSFLADGSGPYLRTGDLGFNRDGELYITGRLKDLIICDGRNHYAEDIEHTVEQSHSALRPGDCVAFSVDVEHEECLVILAELPRILARNALVNGSLHTEVTNAIRAAVSENHDIRVHTILLLKSGDLLKTSSGKIRRQACRTAFVNGSIMAQNVAEVSA